MRFFSQKKDMILFIYKKNSNGDLGFSAAGRADPEVMAELVCHVPQLNGGDLDQFFDASLIFCIGCRNLSVNIVGQDSIGFCDVSSKGRCKKSQTKFDQDLLPNSFVVSKSGIQLNLCHKAAGMVMHFNQGVTEFPSGVDKGAQGFSNDLAQDDSNGLFQQWWFWWRKGHRLL